MGKNTPSAGLQVMQNWRVEWMISQVTVLLSWGTLKGWRNGMAGISWNSSLGNTKPCAWGGIIPCTSAHCGVPDWKPALWEKAWGSWWWRPSQQCILTAKKANCIWGYKRRSVTSSLPFLLLSPSGTHVYCQVHSWGLQYKWDTEILKPVQWRGTKMIEAWSIRYKIVNIVWTGEVNSTKTCNCCLI